MATIEPVAIELLDKNQSLPEREVILAAFAEHYRAAIQRARERAAAVVELAEPDFGDAHEELPTFHELAAAAEESGVLEAAPAGAGAGDGGAADEPLPDIFAGSSDFDLGEDPFAGLETGGGTVEDMQAASLFDADAFGGASDGAPAEPDALFSAFDDDAPELSALSGFDDDAPATASSAEASAPLEATMAMPAMADDDDDALPELADLAAAEPASAPAPAEPEATMMMQAWVDDDEPEATKTIAAISDDDDAAAAPVEASAGDDEGDDGEGGDTADGDGDDLPADAGPKTRQSRRSRRKSKKGTKA
ncbi:MAG: hypothetical protein H6745_02130 [Deltaproteobacteria bacterium]|nr:hypothetical protein [Deltaproteobacteria bacterium]